MNVDQLSVMWDVAIAAFLEGGGAVPDGMRSWAASYVGRGRGEVELDAFPEPFLGDLTTPTTGSFLALNPGRAHLRMQGRAGVFADEIRKLGSYSAWAATWPYLRDPWVAEFGRNRHHFARLHFLRTWTGDESATGEEMVAFELYPWHSTAVTAVMRPPLTAISGFVWEPLRQIGAPVFAFGAPWFPILEGLGLEVVATLGMGGRPYGSAVASRSVTVFRDGNMTVVAERHAGDAGPPRRDEALLLRDAIDRWVP